MKVSVPSALVAVCLIATLSSCSKDEQVVVKPAVVSENPLDPEGYGFYYLPDRELYYYEDKVSAYIQAGKNYLKLKPLSLEKYKNGMLLDSVCNKDIALRFENKGRISFDKSELWALKPRVADEHPPFITFNTDYAFTIKLSKMVNAIGMEFNSPYRGVKYDITFTYFNTKLNKVIPPTYTSYLYPAATASGPQLGSAGGAMLRSIKSETPFDEIRVVYHYGDSKNPPPAGTFDLVLAGFRYLLAE
jgi:hypothetical protein